MKPIIILDKAWNLQYPYKLQSCRLNLNLSIRRRRGRQGSQKIDSNLTTNYLNVEMPNWKNTPLSLRTDGGNWNSWRQLELFQHTWDKFWTMAGKWRLLFFSYNDFRVLLMQSDWWKAMLNVGTFKLQVNTITQKFLFKEEEFWILLISLYNTLNALK